MAAWDGTNVTWGAALLLPGAADEGACSWGGEREDLDESAMAHNRVNTFETERQGR